MITTRNFIKDVPSDFSRVLTKGEPLREMIPMIRLIETHRALVIVSFPVAVISVIFSIMAFACALNESLSSDGNNNDENFIKTHLLFVVFTLKASPSVEK